MSFEIYVLPSFRKSAKVLMKRHHSLKSDIATLFKTLEKNPFQGDELSPGLRKIRMSITSKGRGKSGGARVITYTVLAKEQDGKVYMVEIYDKADYATVDVNIIKSIVAKLNL